MDGKVLTVNNFRDLVLYLMGLKEAKEINLVESIHLLRHKMGTMEI